MSRQIKPKRLLPGARIGIVNPAYWMEAERQQRAVGVFEELGYELVLGHSTKLQQNIYAGSPEERAADIMAMFRAPSIDAIICARGGYGGNRVTPLLDYALIRANPKIFMGYSDTTDSLTSIAQRSGLISFHGPMLSTFGTQTIDYNLDTLLNILCGEADLEIRSPEACQARTLRPGKAQGPLWGGNLALVNARLGTAGQIDTSGAILFLEDINEDLYRLDRMLLHLKHSGSLERIAGLVIGEMLNCGDTEIPFGKTVDEIVLDVCSDLDIPIISNFPCGHGDYQVTLPVSHDVELNALDDEPFIRIPDSPVA
jgi:muramoyltetrapeptide carboxypeptidase